MRMQIKKFGIKTLATAITNSPKPVFLNLAHRSYFENPYYDCNSHMIQVTNIIL